MAYTSRPSSVIFADYCQGSQQYAESSRGKQCMTNCLMFLVHSHFKPVKEFDKADLHVILDSGDMLYRTLSKTNDMLLVSDLPKCLRINHAYITSTLSKTFAGIMAPGLVSSGIGYSLDNALGRAFRDVNASLVIFHSSAIGILKENGMYYVFDSHSRGADALCQPEGSSVLSILPNLSTLCGFLRALCCSLSKNNLTNVQFEVHGLRVKQVKAKPKAAIAVTHLDRYRYIVNQRKPTISIQSCVLPTANSLVDLPLPFLDKSNVQTPHIRKRTANLPSPEEKQEKHGRRDTYVKSKQYTLGNITTGYGESYEHSHKEKSCKPQYVISADYCQGSQQYAESSRGKQCMTNCLMFLVHSHFKPVKEFDKADLHVILDSGDMLYRTLSKTDDMLLVSDLPKCLRINHAYIASTLSKTFAGIMAPGPVSSGIGYSLESALGRAFRDVNASLVIFHSSAIGILKENGMYYVFDSHSRGADALCQPEGSSVLSILPNLSTLCGFLRALCCSLSKNNLTNVQFEVHGLRVKQVKTKPKSTITYLDTYRQSVANHRKISNSLLLSLPTMYPLVNESVPFIVPNSSQSTTTRKRKNINQETHKDVKASKICIQGKQTPVSKSTQDDMNSKCIEAFKKEVSDGPVYVCTCCTQTWFASSVLNVNNSLNAQSDFAKSCYNGIKSHNSCEWICITCLGSILKRQMPACAIKNGMGFPSKPLELDITEMEERLISPRIPFMQLYEKPRGGQRSLRGNIVNVPTDVDSTMKSLPRTLANTETIQVKLKRRLSNKHSVMYQSIRPNKCIDALKWLLQNSLVFQHEGIRLNESWQINEQNTWYDIHNANSDSDQPNEDLGKMTNLSESSTHAGKGYAKSMNITEDLYHPEKDFVKTNHIKGDSNPPEENCLGISHATEGLNQSKRSGLKMANIAEQSCAITGEGTEHSEIVQSNVIDRGSNKLEERFITHNKAVVECSNQPEESYQLVSNANSISSSFVKDNSCLKTITAVEQDVAIKGENDSDDSDGWTEVKQFEDRITGNTDTLLHPADVRALNRTLTFAPGEGQTPLGLYRDKDAEYLAFPTIYCGQRRPDNKSRKTPVHYSTICRWEMRCQDRRAACSIPNLFFKMKKLQIKQIQDKVALAMRKCKDTSKKITAADVLNSASFDNVVRLNEGFRVLRTIRGSPAYWEQAKKDIFAMIRQLGIPTWFCSFSAAETRWHSLLRVLGKLLKNKDFTDEELQTLPWVEKCELIKSDPVTCARYFQNRVQVFISKVLKGDSEPLGKLKDFFYRVEFQQRGSPHIHMLAWIENAPRYGQDANHEVESFIDAHSTCSKESDRPDLINYQTHRHARTCRKRGKAVCRFGFPLFPMHKTLILEPLKEDEYETNPKAQANFINICEMLQSMTMGEEISFPEFLQKLEMTEEMYLNAIRSSLTSPKLFLSRKPSEVRINSYNKVLLESWEANIDVQFVLDAYSCASYIVSYISKGQRGMSNLLYQACRDVQKGNTDLKQQVRHIGNKFLTHVEVCAQEAAYLVLQMNLRRSSRSVVFINTSEPKDRTYLLKPTHILEDMPKNSTNIESDNHVKRYQRRPRAMQQCCLADFVSKFEAILPNGKRKKVKQSSDGYLLENIEEANEDENEGLDENNLDDFQTLDDEIQDVNTSEYLMRDGTVLKKRSTMKIIRYVRFSKVHDAENHYREQLMLFKPWRDEISDLLGEFNSYEQSYQYHLHTMQANKKDYEDKGAQDIELVEDHLQMQENARVVAPGIQHIEEIDRNEESTPSALYGCFDPGQTQQNYDLAVDLGITRKQIDSKESYVNDMSNDEYMTLAQSLNSKQEMFFYHVLHWFKTESKPIYCFLTGGAGVGKSVLTTALFQAITRFFAKQLGECPDETKAVLCAPTGKAAHNIGGSTIHSLICIPANQGFRYKPLDSQQLDSLRVKFHSLKVVFIDEISMVGNKMFNYINRRLQEIFASYSPFGGVSVIAIGDLYQLKPVMDGWIFEDLKEDFGPLAMNLWIDNFQLFELTEIMRQKDDAEFANLLNRLREGLHTSEDLTKLSQHIIEEPEPVSRKPFLFTTNAEVNTHNETAFQIANIDSKCSVQAIDTVNGDMSETVKSKILDQIPNNPSKTMGLLQHLAIAENLPAEVCVNVDVEDGLTNGTPGIVKKLDFRVNDSARCSIIWVLFPEPSTGSKTRMKFSHLYAHGICKTWTPVLEITRKFPVGRNQSCFVTRRQYPLRLAAAKTIHKAQGSTMDTAVLHFGNRKQEHMHYVGLSRVRKLENVHILKLSENKISVSQAVTQEMNRLRQHAYLQPCIPSLNTIQTDLKIVYHNSRSLHLHISDLVAQDNMLSADIIAISESRLQPSDHDSMYKLPGFTMIRADDSTTTNQIRPYKGMVLYSKIHLGDIKSFTLFGVETVIATILHRDVLTQLVFIYNPPPNANITNFILFLRDVLQTVNSDLPLIIMGDVNIDIMQRRPVLETFLEMNEMQQIMHSVTTDYSTCLDHIYTSHLSRNEISCATLESYYSDHKPIAAYLPFQ